MPPGEDSDACSLAPVASSPEAIEALRRGAARGLSMVLHARHPDLSFEVTADPAECRRILSEADQADGWISLTQVPSIENGTGRAAGGGAGGPTESKS
jgi:hypothetical protein